MTESHAEDRDVESKSAPLPNFGFDFSRITIHPTATGEIQPKLAISKPGDEYEREADRIADQVTATPARTNVSDVPPPIQPLPGQTVGQSDAAAASVEHALASSGDALEPTIREDMERRFGFDFSRVRVHRGARAEQSARDVNATAYTLGHQMVFGAGQFAPGTHEGQRLLAHELTHVVQQSRFPQSRRVMREPNDPVGTSKPPVPIPGHTPFNFISESPALANWKAAVKGMLEREFKMKFGTFEEAQQHFRKHLQGLPSDSAREDFADRMRDRARKAFYRTEGRNPSYAYKGDDIAKLKKGAAPERGMQLEHLEDVKSKQRGGSFIKGRPESALDPGNIYVTEGGPGGTAPTGTKHAEKYRTIEAAKKASREIRDRATQAAVKAEGTTAKESAKPPTTTPAEPPVATTTAPKLPTSVKEPPITAPTVKPPAAPSPTAAPAPASPVHVGPASPSKPRPSVSGAPPTAAAPRSKGRASLSGGQIQISSGTAWTLAGKVGKGASAVLTIWDAFSTIDDALAQIEKAKTGSVAPQVATAIKAVEATFPSAEAVRKDVLWYGFESEEKHPRAKNWLQEKGVEALMVKGDTLKEMGDELSTVRDYVWDQEKLEREFKEYDEKIKPLRAELKKRTRVLYDIVHDLEGLIPYMLSSSAAASVWGIRTTFWNAAQDLGRLESIVSYRQWQYEQAFRGAQKERRAAAEIFNYWAPAFAKIWKQQTGKTASPTNLPTD